MNSLSNRYLTFVPSNAERSISASSGKVIKSEIANLCVKRSGVTAFGFQAGRLIFLDRARALEYANRHGIAVVGMESGLPPAPTRP